MVSFTISSIISEGDQAIAMILRDSGYDLSGDKTMKLLEAILKLFDEIDRFSNPDGLERWNLEINQTEDEGFEFLIIHDSLELLAFIMEDDDDYDLEDIIESTSIDSVHISNYGDFLRNEEDLALLMSELRAWEADSDYHPYAIDHLQALVNMRFKLPVFGGDEDAEVELSFDSDEIFIGSTDEGLEASVDYSLAHEHFDVDSPEESLEMGLQSWSEFVEEDDDWEDDLDEDEDEFEEFEDDWDPEADEEWDPGFDDEED